MTSKFVLILLACTVATCNTEAPIGGYNNRTPQQQSGPYPAAGYKPIRTFNLPSDEAIAQQLRFAQIIKLQQQYQRLQLQQQQQAQSQRQPSQLYGAPSGSEESLPQQPSGGPQGEQQPQLTRPQRPSVLYGSPSEGAASQQPQQLVRPLQPSRKYEAPQDTAASQRQLQFQRQQQPSSQYGAPQEAPATPDSNSAESLEESKEVDNVIAVSNALENKPSRLTQGSDERDTESDEKPETTPSTQPATAAAQPTGFVLVPLAAAGYTPQKLAFFQAPAPANAQFAKLQLPPFFGVQQPNLLAPQLLTTQSYYQPQQFAFSAPLQQAW